METQLDLQPLDSQPLDSQPSANAIAKGRAPWAIGPLFMTILITLTFAGCKAPTNEYAPPPPPEVTTARPVKQKLTLFLEQNGETEPVEQAEVRARVRGFVQEITFDPGQIVKKGDELYRIEPDLYQATKASAAAAVEAAKAAVAVAEATQGTAEAEIKNAEANFAREERLLKSNAGSQSTYDAAVAARDSAKAQLGAAIANVEAEKAKLLQAQAALDQAELDLKYTTVRAPIDGRVSKTDVKLGNLVDLGTSLVSVVDQSTIFANFSISDRDLMDLMETRPKDERATNTPEDWSKVAVYLQRDSQKNEWQSGHLDYVDQEGVDQSTGTFALRAVFDNSQRELMPGMFVMIRLPIRAIEDAILVPEKAITRSQMGEFLLVVGDENKVERRPVTLGQRLDGWVLVTDGIEADESFILEGLQRARPGAEVNPSEIELSTEDSPILQASILLGSDPNEKTQDE